MTTTEIDPVDALRAAAAHLRARAEEMRSTTPGGRKSFDLLRAAAQCEREVMRLRNLAARKAGEP